MLFIKTNSLDPFYNLAVEEYFLFNSDQDIFMLWQNKNTAVIGRNQNVYAEIDVGYAKSQNITVVRRITGGGAVYHDLGNVNYTFITSREKSGTLNFSYFTSPIISALRQYGIDAQLSGRNDIMCGDAKFSGNAQYCGKDRILHHGTLLFDSDLSVMPKLLTVDPDKIKSKSIKSVRSRVANLKPLFNDGEMTVARFMELIEQHVCKMYGANQYSITTEQKESILKLREKYADPAWTYTARAEFSNRSKRYFPFGLVDIYYSVKDGQIKDIEICGDFFGTRDVAEIKARLISVKHLPDAVNDALAGIDIDSYISGMQKDEFIKMLFE